MASTIKSTREKEERRQALRMYLKSNSKNGERPVLRHTLIKEFKTSGVTIDRDILYLKETYPDNMKHTRNKGYWWKEEEEPVMETKQPEIDRYPSTKTDEGYPDPTASAAMNCLPDKLFSKDIWTYGNSVGETEVWLIIGAVSNRMTGVRLYEGLDEVSDFEYHEIVPVTNKGDVVYYFNPTRMQSKPAKYFKEKIGTLSDALYNKVTASLNLYLGLSNVDVKEIVVEKEKIVEKTVEVPVEVEKIVEKVVEVPVEVPAEADGETLDEYTKTLFHDLELAKQKADIYEDIVNKLLAR